MRANEDKIAQLLDKTTDFDKDERYMATSDLCVELNKDVDLGSYLEPKVCVAVLKQLDDKSNDVQSIAVKCLGILVTKVQVAQVADICSKLCDLILNGKSELRDIYSIGLKTIVADVSQSTGASIANSICVRLLTSFGKDKDVAVKAETLDILNDILRRFGYDVSTEHATIMELLMMQLNDESPLVRKRATACLGSLGVMASDVLVSRLVEHLIQGIQRSTDFTNVRTLIQTIGMLSRTAGHRLGQHLDAVIRILMHYCGQFGDESMQNEDSDELRAICFQAFESFVIRCHNEIMPHVEPILELVMQFIFYDPNYNYVDSADEDEDMNEDEEEYSDEDGGYSDDDDDTSWKVRRAALRVLAAIITTRPELLEQLYLRCAQPLISRFKEREDNVRVDVFGVFSELLRTTRRILSSSNGTSSFQQQTSNPCITQLEMRLNALVNAANKQFGMKASVSSRCAVVTMLSELAMVEHGKLGDFIGRLIPNILNAVEDKHSDLKLDALLCLRLLVDTHTMKPFQSHIDSIVRIAVQCANGDWYKTVAKALSLIESLVRIIRSTDDRDLTYKAYAIPLFEAVLPRLKIYDVDQEIKEAAISSIGTIVAVLGDELGSRVEEVYPLLLERLHNEVTRVHSIKAIGVIARSKLSLDMSPVLVECTQTLAHLLRQQSRPLKQATLSTLTDLVVSKGESMSVTLLCEVVQEASHLLTDTDLQLCRMSITLVSNSIQVCPSVTLTKNFLENAQPEALKLCHSSMLQSPTLDVLKDFFAQLTQLNSRGSSFTDLFEALMRTPTEESKHSVLNIARCVAGVCAVTSEENRAMALAKFIGDITQIESERKRILALHCLGEFGRKSKLAGYSDFKELIFKSLNDSSEEVKAAAAYSLGSICVGNMEEYLDSIMVKLECGENSYLLLTSLREVISDHVADPHHGIATYVNRVLPVLQDLSARQEEGVRNMVSECMGKLAVTNGSKIMPIVAELCQSSDIRSRWTAVTSLKYAMTTTAQDLDAIFAYIDPFLTALEDEDIHVRRAALLTLNTAIHHHPHYLVPYVRDRIFPVLLKTTEIKLERVVDLGPFKHKVDDGLPLRKAAYSCVETLIQVLPQQLDISLFIDQLKRGLGDLDDIQMLSHQILIKICNVQPGSIVGALDSLVEPLEKTINKKVKEDQVGPEIERAKDLIRSALRALDAMSVVNDANSHPRLNTVIESAKKNKLLCPLLDSIRSERSTN
ncbi:TATA-binding protein-interacting protein [Plasmopara halstedii]|uniref:TATA-binding protein-interacting protein n=1 Tax=Plasmopara halstedii TaxID=4781 RepID=A0A0N7L7J0_PLAHL|nr:TATA-binding protein-interacting protein [Plasmopara halstedii]CEG47211.1 TATA-binding protein-interacting protein [Plasmopara halstedii]|eukprot:XP_024583580.1 TATA-binding protein-interacting protein [Plasmopara halstedii]